MRAHGRDRFVKVYYRFQFACHGLRLLSRFLGFGPFKFCHLQRSLFKKDRKVNTAMQYSVPGNLHF